TIIPSLVLPLSIVGTFIAMWALSFSLDILSLLALTLSVGFIIDDAIVVLENIVRHHENGSTAVEAALKGSKQIGFTIVSMTLSLIAVFIPLLFRGDITGRLFREFSMTLVISIAISAFISLTLTPLLCSKFLSSHQKETLVQKWATRWNQALLRFYDKTLKWCFRFRKTTLLAAAVSFGATIFLFRFVSVDLFPEEDRSFIWCAANLPKGISKEKTEQFESKIVAILRENPYIDSFLSLSFYGQQMFLMQLPPGNKRPPQATLIAEMQKQINSIPGVLAFIKGVQLISPGMGSHSGSKYQYILRGLNLEELQASAEKLKSALQALPEFPSVHVDLELNDPKLMIELFDEEIEKLGLSKQAVQHLLQQAYSGASIGKIEKETDQYKVFVELAPEFQKKPDSLSDLYLRTSEGISVPLKALARWKETVGLPSIPHIDLLPSATLSFDIAEGVALNKGLELLQRTAQATLPGSISAKLEGTAELIESTVRDTVLLIILAVVAMYIVLGILYESFLHPLTILSSLPLASLGGILTLLIFKEPLSLYSMIGFILLIGIVKKNGIMMVDHAIEVRKTKESSPFEAIYEACLVRLRPIMMTTIAAIMGALPIAIGIGAGADTRRGLGLVIAGGLLFSQLLTLYVTPIIYLYLETLKEKTR
ncbi:MAG: efflux RND transporter permease subunit, partial [Anaerolineae bacterium]